MPFNILKLPAPVSLLLWAGLWEVIGLSGLVEIIPTFHTVVLNLGSVVGSREFQQEATRLRAAW